ncbi:MAG TPA: hypothetical protein VKY19_21555 [Ktedonosporobacter sp.]|nr:hypothetical protein [Ktedonosporobacter sp.]
MHLRFEAKKGKLSYHGQVVYRREEWSLDFLPNQVSDFDVIIVDMLNIAFLVMDTSIAYACQICGYHPHTIWIKKELSLPTFFEGSLILHSDVVNEFDNVKLEGAERWKTYYDEALGWLCIGNERKDQEDRAVEFATGIIAVVNKQRLKSLWLKPIFI